MEYNIYIVLLFVFLGLLFFGGLGFLVRSGRRAAKTAVAVPVQVASKAVEIAFVPLRALAGKSRPRKKHPVSLKPRKKTGRFGSKATRGKRLKRGNNIFINV